MSGKNMVEESKMENEQASETATSEQNPPKGRSGKKWGVLAGAIVVLAIVLVGVIAGISIYNTPENRLERQLQTAYKYLEAGNYELAALAFEQAILIDEKCIEAYAKGIEAYIKSGNEDGAGDLFERAMEQIEELDEVILTKNLEYIVDIYLLVTEVYGDDPERIAEVLEKGYKLTGGDVRIKNLLIDTYLEIAEGKMEIGRYVESLDIFDRLLELESEYSEILVGLSYCLTSYVQELMDMERYDEIRVLAERSKRYPRVVGLDFEEILREIEILTHPVYTVWFSTGGGGAVASQALEEGSKVVKPEDPKRDGYIFDGWYADEEKTKIWDFAEPIKADVTLYAKWMIDEPEDEVINFGKPPYYIKANETLVYRSEGNPAWAFLGINWNSDDRYDKERISSEVEVTCYDQDNNISFHKTYRGTYISDGILFCGSGRVEIKVTGGRICISHLETANTRKSIKASIEKMASD